MLLFRGIIFNVVSHMVYCWHIFTFYLITAKVTLIVQPQFTVSFYFVVVLHKTENDSLFVSVITSSFMF